jgi:hypothetical protein
MVPINVIVVVLKPSGKLQEGLRKQANCCFKAIQNLPPGVTAQLSEMTLVMHLVIPLFVHLQVCVLSL